MLRNQENKAKKHTLKQGDRYFVKKEKKTVKNGCQNSNAKIGNLLKTEKCRKSVQDKKKKCKSKIQKPKQIKFITEEIEKSTQEILTARSQSQRKQRPMILSPAVKILEENAYEFCNSTKRYPQPEYKPCVLKKEHKYSLHLHGGIINLNKIKIRAPKSQSKDQRHSAVKSINSKPREKTKSTKKTVGKTSRQSELTPHKRRFLSPDVAQIEHSYYFSHNQDSQNILDCEDKLHKSNTENLLTLPKRQSMFIFESNDSVWQNNPNKSGSMHSTFDLLN